MTTITQPPAASSYAHAAGRRSSAPHDSASSPASAPQPPPRWGAIPSDRSKLHRHRPRTTGEEAHVYVLTLRLSSALHDALNELRTRYFPSERLKVPAHLTLFHALPHSELDKVHVVATSVAGQTRPFKVATGQAFLLGRNGVAIAPGEGTEEGARVHARLREEWQAFLSKQDSKGFKAHWTVQNKVSDEDKVLATFDEVRKWTREEGAQGAATGLVLWRYDRGHWVFEHEFPFEGATASNGDKR